MSKIQVAVELDTDEILSDCFEPEDGIDGDLLEEVVELMNELGLLEEAATYALYEHITDNAHEFIAAHFGTGEEGK